METLEQNPVMNQDPAMGPAPQFQPDGARPMLGFWEAVKICWSKYADFTGRARRSEYWWFSLFIFLVMLLPLIGVIAMYVIHNEDAFAAMVLLIIVLAIISLVFLVPSLAVTTRRLHDTGRSGWWIVASYAVSVFSQFVQDFIFDPGTLGASSFSTASTGALIVWGVVNLINLGLSITILVFMLLDSHKGENKYGPSPKYVEL